MEKFYSQHGEDFLVDKVFKDKKDGFFVEVGCLDGIEFSNTYFFEKKGWKGICIEAHNDFIPMLKKNRPGSHVVHCAAGEDDKDKVTFYANKIGSLSTLDKNEEERWKTHYKDFFTGFEEQTVSMRTLTNIFDEFGVKNIEFVSLDIEGYEIQALKGLDLKKYKPRIFIIEYKDEDHKKGVEDILLPYGYVFGAQIGCNLFYTTDLEDKPIFNKDYGTIALTHVDHNGVETVLTKSFSKPTILQRATGKVKRMIKSIIVPQKSESKK